MKSIARRIAATLKKTVNDRIQKARRRQLEKELAGTFQRLEPRRVLAVAAAFDPSGILNIEFSGDTSADHAVLMDFEGDPNQFLLDLNGNGSLDDINEIAGLKSQLAGIRVTSIDVGGGGKFDWSGDFTDASIEYVDISGVESVEFSSQATIAGPAAGELPLTSISTQSSIVLGGAITFSNDVVLSTDNGGKIETHADAELVFLSHLSLQATTIDFGTIEAGGGGPTDNIVVDQVHFLSDGIVRIGVDSDIQIQNFDVFANNAGTVLLSAKGKVIVQDAITVSESGHVYIHSDQDVVVQSSITTSNGHVVLHANDDIHLGSGAIINAGGSGNISITAESNNIVDPDFHGIQMLDGSSVTTKSGVIRLSATSYTESSIQLGALDAGTGDVVLSSNFGILDGNGDGLNIKANTAVILNTVGGSVGSSSGEPEGSINNPNAIDIDVDKIAVVSSGSVYLSGANGLTVGEVDGKAFDLISIQNTIISTSHGGATGITVTGYTVDDVHVKIQLVTGSLTLDEVAGKAVITAGGSGDVLLQTRANDGDIYINGKIASTAGNIAIISGDDVYLNRNVSTTGSVYIKAHNGSNPPASLNGVVMSEVSSVESSSGNVGIETENQGNIWLSRIEANSDDTGSGVVALDSAGSIINILASGNVNISASDLIMIANEGSIGLLQADGGVSSGNINPINTDVHRLAASSRDGIFITEADSVVVDLLQFEMNVPAFDSGNNAVTIELEDLSTSATSDVNPDTKGSIKLQSRDGSITINSGTGATHGIYAATTGDLLLEALGDNGDVNIHAALMVSNGNATIIASGAIVLEANLEVAQGNASLKTSQDLSFGGTVMASDTVVVQSEGSLTSTIVGIVSERAILFAGSTIGGSSGTNSDINSDSFKTNVKHLTAESYGSIFLQNQTELTIDNMGVAEESLVTFNSPNALNYPKVVVEPYGVRTLEEGSIRIQTFSGDLNVEAAISVSLNGADVLLQSLAGDVSVNSSVSTFSGVTTIVASDDVIFGKDAEVSTEAGDIYVLSSNLGDPSETLHGIRMDSKAAISSASGNIILESTGGGAVSVSSVRSTDGDIAIKADGSITSSNGSTVNLDANQILLRTNAGVGNGAASGGSSDTDTWHSNPNALHVSSDIIAVSSFQNVYLYSQDNITVANVDDVHGSRTWFNDSATPIHSNVSVANSDGIVMDADGNGSVKIQTDDANIVLDQTLKTYGDGVILLQTLAGGRIFLNNNLEAGKGNISIVSSTGVSVVAPISVTSESGDIYWRQGEEYSFSSAIEMSANDIYIHSDHSITTGISHDNPITANNLYLYGKDGIGGASVVVDPTDLSKNENSIKTDAKYISAASEGAIYIENVSNLTIGLETDTAFSQVFFNSQTYQHNESNFSVGIHNTNSAPIKVLVTDGRLAVEGTVESGHGAASPDSGGDIHLGTLNGNIEINNKVVSSDGHISVVSSGNMQFGASGAVHSGGNGMGTIHLSAAGSNGIQMQANTVIRSDNSNIFIETKQLSGGGIVLGLVDAGEANVLIRSSNAITDANDSEINIIADNAFLFVMDAGGIGGPDSMALNLDTNSNAIGLDVNTVAAISQGSVYLQGEGGLTIGKVGEIEVQSPTFSSQNVAISADGAQGITTPSDQPNHIKIYLSSGDLIVASHDSPDELMLAPGKGGDLLLQAIGKSSDIVINGNVSKELNSMAILAGDDVRLNRGISTEGDGSIYLRAGNGDVEYTPGDLTTRDGIVMGSGVSITTANGNVALETHNSGDIWLNSVMSTANGSVALVSNGSIINNLATADINVQSQSLLMTADNGSIGVIQSDGTIFADLPNFIRTEVGALSAKSRDGIFVSEKDGVTVDHISVGVKLPRFNSNLDSATFTLEDLETQALSSAEPALNGAIKIQSQQGAITVNSGLDSAFGIRTAFSSDVLLQTVAVAPLIAEPGDIVINARLITHQGNVTFDSADDVHFGSSGSIEIQAGDKTAGSVFITAANGLASDAGSAVSMSATSSIRTNGGNVFIDSEGDVAVATITADSGHIAIDANGAITNANPGNSTNLSGDHIALKASDFIGGIDQVFPDYIIINSNRVATVAPNGIFLRSTGASPLEVGNVSPVDVHNVDFLTTDAGLVSSASASGLVAASGHIQLFGVGNVLIDASIVAGDAASNTYDVTLASSAGSIEEKAGSELVFADVLTVRAQQHIHLSGVSASILNASSGSGSTLDAWQLTNSQAAMKGTEFLDILTDANGVETQFPDVTPPSFPNLDPGQNLLPDKFNFRTQYDSAGYSLYIVNDRSLTVENAIAQGQNSHLYIETKGGDLNIDGNLTTIGSNVAGGIILVAGQKLTMDDSAWLQIQLPSGFNYNTYGQSFDSSNPNVTSNVAAHFYHGGTGSGGELTSRYVLDPVDLSGVSSDTHLKQQVVLNFGVAGENGFTTFIGYADQRVQVFDSDAIPELVTAKPHGSSSGGVFIRTSDMKQEFFDIIMDLPTEVIIRRADGFYFFEGADSADTIVDRSYDWSPIEDVSTRIVRPTANLPLDPVVSIPVSYNAEIVQQVDDRQIDFYNPPPVELVFIPEPTARVEVYRVDYLDMNHDGQPDQNELPSPEDLRQSLGDESGEQKPELIRIPKEAMPDLRTGTITAEDIEKIRQALLKDPTTPSGAYSIILRTPDQKVIIVDIFSVRDFADTGEEGADIQIQMRGDKSIEEGQQLPGNESTHGDQLPNAIDPIQDPINPPAADPQSINLPANRESGMAIETELGRSRPIATTAVALSALWVGAKRKAGSFEDANAETAGAEASTVNSFSGVERRRRRLSRIFGK